MNVLAFLTSPAFAQLRRALPPPHRVSNAGDWPAVIASVRKRECDVAVLDPCAGGEHSGIGRVGALVDAIAAAPGTPVVAYVSVTAGAMRSVHGLARLASSAIIIRGVDDRPDTIAAVVHRVISACAGDRVVQSAGDAFRALPPSLADALETLFHRPERVRSVSALAAEAKTTRRSLDRWLARTGLAPARTLLSCARVSAAFQLLVAGHVRPPRAAAMLGYASPRALARELQALTGLVPSTLPTHLTRDAVTAVLGQRLRRSSPASTPHASY